LIGIPGIANYRIIFFCVYPSAKTSSSDMSSLSFDYSGSFL